MTEDAPRPHVVVVGGGIAGLTAAHRLVQASPGARVTLLDAARRLGGRIRTEPLGGRPLDMGPDALLTRMPAGISLCEELGIAGDLVAPATGQALVWSRGRLRPLPPRMLEGAPGGAGAFLRSGVLSPRGVARAGLDLVLPARIPEGDVTIGALVRARMGNEALERLVDPLLGGIHAGTCDELSAQALAPMLLAALREKGSLIRGLRAQAAGRPPATGSPFASFPEGLERLPAALQAALRGADVRTGTRVEALTPLAGGRVRVVLAGDEAIEADGVVLAVPAGPAAALLEPVAPQAAAPLRELRHASVAVVAMRFPRAALAALPEGSGFLVPRPEGRLMTACTISSSKWAHLSSHDDVILKCSAGRAGDHRAMELDDHELRRRLRAELAEALGVRGKPAETRVARFEDALAQYAPGHRERIEEVERAAAAALPGLRLAGAAYHGAGLSSCIASGRAAADAVLQLSRPNPTPPVETIS